MHNVFYSFPPHLVTPTFLTGLLFLGIIAVWSLVLKVLAVWYSARAGQKGWFVVLLIVNTLGILELIYFIWFRPKTTDSIESVIVPLPKEGEPVQS
jgi:D-alanyl-lipoteichoic acid acyltransferase DltB (MBOAT superfamily)